MKRIVFNNLNEIQGKNKNDNFKNILQDSGVTLHDNDNYGSNYGSNYYGGTTSQETPDEIIAVADDSAIVSEPTFEEEVIEAQEDDDITGQVEAPVTKLPEEPKEEEQFVSKEEPEFYKDDIEDEDEEDDEEEKEEEEVDDEEYEIPFDYISLKEKYPLDIWGLIDTYFRDNEYYKSKHQLDSFNEFI